MLQSFTISDVSKMLSIMSPDGTHGKYPILHEVKYVLCRKTQLEVD